MLNDNTHELISIRNLSPSAYVLRLSRRGLAFRAGQHILLGEAGSIHNREYSIYSGEHDDFFDVLVKEVDDGLVSKQLKKVKPGNKLQLEGPLGFFTIEPDQLENGKFLFVATGTGIAPFHSFVRSYLQIDYQLIHGVRYASEAYDKDAYHNERYILCTSGDEKGDFKGRVTEYLRQHPVDPETHCYLCGNFNMIHEVFDLLEQQGLPPENVHAEVYF